MRKTLGWVLLIGLGLTSTTLALAEEAAPRAAAKAPQATLNASSPEDVERYVTALSSARRKLFSEAMGGLTAPQLEAFWSVYADYEKDKNELALARVEAINKFANSFGRAEGLSDADVTEAINEMAALQRKQIDLRVKYFNTLSSRIDAKAAGRFALTDDFVQTAVRLDWLNQIPFPGDAKTAK